MRCSLARLLLTATFLLVAPPTLRAQQVTTPLAPGAAIRVTAPETLPRRTMGSFLSAERDTLWLAAERSPRVGVPLAAVERLEVRAGRSRWKWAGIGAAAGLLTFGIAGGVVGGGEEDITGMGAAAGFVAGAAQGIVVGAIVGALAAPRRWLTYPVTALR